jgi:ATP-dependent RNA helicase RhlB
MRTCRDSRESTERKDKGDRKPKGKKPVYEKKPVHEKREKAAEALPAAGRKKPAARPEKAAQPQKEKRKAPAAAIQAVKGSVKEAGKKESVSRKPLKDGKRPSRKASPDKRMDYYKEKYGEDFVVNREIKAVTDPKEKKSIVEKIKSFFKGKKK